MDPRNALLISRTGGGPYVRTTTVTTDGSATLAGASVIAVVAVIASVLSVSLLAFGGPRR